MLSSDSYGCIWIDNHPPVLTILGDLRPSMDGSKELPLQGGHAFEIAIEWISTVYPGENEQYSLVAFW